MSLPVIKNVLALFYMPLMASDAKFLAYQEWSWQQSSNHWYFVSSFSVCI